MALSFGLGCVLTYGFMHKAFVKAVREEFEKQHQELRILRARLDQLQEEKAA